MRDILKRIAHRMPVLKRIFEEREALRDERDRLKSITDLLRAPPGHFNSPIPSIEEIKLREETIFGNISREIPGIDLNEEVQLGLLDKLKNYYDELPYQADKGEGLRFSFKNPSFGYGDAIVLYCMIRQVQPKRIIEVGAGYSSCVILDTNEFFFDNAISCSFIDPYPELFLSLIKDSDKARIELLKEKLQDVDVNRFLELSAGDILSIDSSHVSKIGSDVNYVFFKLLPVLKAGVHIHIHDIFYPFEYPREWIYERRAMSEAYVLRAFLQYNHAFEIQFFNSFLHHIHRKEFSEALPLSAKGCGCGIWLRKV